MTSGRFLVATTVTAGAIAVGRLTLRYQQQNILRRARRPAEFAGPDRKHADAANGKRDRFRGGS